jgi:TonB family protein
MGIRHRRASSGMACAFCLAAGLAFAGAATAATVTPAAAAVETQPAADRLAVLENAQKLFKLQQFSEAAAEFERANQLSGGPCTECLFGMAGAYAVAGQRDRALAAAREVIHLAPKAPLLAEAYSLLAMLEVADRTDDKTLAEAEADLRKAVELDRDRASYRIDLALILMRENRPLEALDLARSAAAGWSDDTARRAHVLVCDARAALPQFLQGEPPKELADDEAAVMRVTPDRSDSNQVTRPEILSRVQPQYTEAARKGGVEGVVVLESIIDEEGCVTRVKLLKSLDPGLDEFAATAVRHWTFKPAMQHGKPVKVYYSLTINFQVDKTPPRKPL